MRKKNERKLLEAIRFLNKSDISGKQGPAVPGPPKANGAEDSSEGTLGLWKQIPDFYS